jgi:hypothetical protein
LKIEQDCPPCHGGRCRIKRWHWFQVGKICDRIFCTQAALKLPVLQWRQRLTALSLFGGDVAEFALGVLTNPVPGKKTLGIGMLLLGKVCYLGIVLKKQHTMATDKKHIAVYLDPAVEQALIAFCEQKGLKSKKGFMYSAGVNAVLAAFFGIADIDNILQSSSNTPSTISTIPSPVASNIPNNATSNTPTGSIDVEVLPGKLRA